jgi:endonuclease/exonuclease/phosphatase family metal-dependent hydrolase
MTFNVLFASARNPAGPWAARRPVAVALVRHWRPDVMGLQEPTAAQVDQLAADLPEYAVVPGPASGPSHLPRWAWTLSPPLAALWLALRWSRRRRPRRRSWRLLLWAIGLLAALPAAAAIGSRLLAGPTADQGEFCAIFYRKTAFRLRAQGAFWLSEQPDRPGSVLLATWLPRVTNWARLEPARSGPPLTVYNTHFDYLNPWARARSAALLRRRMDRAWDGTPQVLLGDFNEGPGGGALPVLERPGPPGSPPSLQNAWAVAARRDGPTDTFHGGTGAENWRGRIDHVFFRPPAPVPGVVVITDHTGSTYPSDHFPLLAEIGF